MPLTHLGIRSALSQGRPAGRGTLDVPAHQAKTVNSSTVS